jgi:hypothetical protein
MPSNAAWLLSQALKPAEALGDAAGGARDQGRRVTAAVVDAAPVGDSVEIRARRARDAAERAREAEERAVEAARESKALADRAREGVSAARLHQGCGARRADSNSGRRGEKAAVEFVAERQKPRRTPKTSDRRSGEATRLRACRSRAS